MRRIGLTIIAFAAFTSWSQAEDSWRTSSDGFEIPAPRLKHWVGLGVGIRTDNNEFIDAQPSIYSQYLWFGTSNVALKVDFGYRNLTKLSTASNIRTLVYGAGVRLQPSPPPGKTVEFYTPFLEFDLNALHYFGTFEGGDFEETRLGFGMAAGLSFRIDGSSTLDLAIHQVFNNVESRSVYGPETGILPQIGDWPAYYHGLGGPDDYDLYNPTNLIIRYRTAL